MKRLLLIPLVLFLACEDKQEKDCAGVEGGIASEDDCGVCVGGTTGEVACAQDCADVWGGNNICGCTDSTATNYDSTATFNDSNCNYDTTPPTVSISSPVSGQTVNEVVTITVATQDNEGISRVEFFIDDSLMLTDSKSPFEYDWNTTTYDDGSYVITVRSYDTSENTTDSEPITLTVDNSVSYPQSVGITSIVFGDGSFTITWNQSTDGDFSSYELEKSIESTMSDYDVIYTSEDLINTNYVDSDADPLIYQYYRVTVIDTFSYATKGQIVSSSLDPIPNSVDVTSVTYTLSEMTVEWEESTDGDFRDYKLLFSETESGDRDTLVTYTDKSTISHILTDFDPTHENWFWVTINDTLGQNSVGSGITNEIDNPPTSSELLPIVHENGDFIISWSQNNDNDFQSYVLLESYSEDMSSSTIIFESNEIDKISYIFNGVSYGEIRYYQLIVEDIWELQNLSNIVAGCSGHMVCDYCIPFDDIVPNFEDDFPNNELSSLCEDYNDIFFETYNVELSNIDSSFKFFPEENNCKVLLSAPHSQQTYRYTVGDTCFHDTTHGRDMRTGVIAKILHNYTGCAVIYKSYLSDDPNYHNTIPECTVTDVFQNITGELLPYKQKILDYIDANPNIKFVMDLHGWKRTRTGDVDLGTMYGESLESQVGECFPEIFAYIFEKWNIFTTIDAQFSASTNETVTKFIHEYIDEIVDAIQFEIENDYRSCSEDAFTTMIYALMEIIIVVNYLYELPTD